MDAFDKLARGFFADLDEAGIVIPKGAREGMLERLAIQARGAHHEAIRSGALNPRRERDDIANDLARYNAELAAHDAAYHDAGGSTDA